MLAVACCVDNDVYVAAGFNCSLVPSPSQFTTDGPSVSVSWCRAPSGAHDQIVVNCLTVAVLCCFCAISDERSGLSFVSHSPQSWSTCT
jgi:hypothetical protein